MPEDEGQLDANLAEDLKEQGAKEQEAQAATEEVGKEEPKTFPEDYVKGLRRENAKYRRQLRETQGRLQPQIPQGPQMPMGAPQMPPPPLGAPQVGYPQQQGPAYDPRVDDMLLDREINTLKQDEYLSELFEETDDEGRTFEERLLETAIQRGVTIENLGALAWELEHDKILGKTKQKAIDEAYKSMSGKADSSAEKSVSSGKNVEQGEVNSIEDAIEAAKKDHGITDLSNLG